MVVVNADGTGKRRLTRRVVFSLAWSPDGRRIAFVNPDYAIYVVGADGTGERRLTPPTTSNNDPAWSPDGRKIVSTRLIDGFHESIFVMDADGAGQRAAVAGPRTTGVGSEPVWSPDGRRIAFTVQHDDPPDQEVVPRPLRHERRRRRRTAALDRRRTTCTPAWSPDGRRLPSAAPRRHCADLRDGRRRQPGRPGSRASRARRPASASAEASIPCAPAMAGIFASMSAAARTRPTIANAAPARNAAW